MSLHDLPDHHHDVLCGDCGEPLLITCVGLAARYTEAACPIGTERHACEACTRKDRCSDCGEIITRKEYGHRACDEGGEA